MSELHDAGTIEANTAQRSVSVAPGEPTRRRRWRRWLSGVASLVVVAAIVGAAVALLRPHGSPATLSGSSAIGSPVVREAKAGGLDFVIRVTPGPYFVGELIEADLSLTNSSHTAYMLDGEKAGGACGWAVHADLTGGNGPQRPPPVAIEHSCPHITSTLAPGETITPREFLYVSTSGEVTLETGAHFLEVYTDVNGDKSLTTASSPLDGLWPTITMQVAATAPANRQITLQQEGTQVRIDAPAAALGHLYYLYTVDCVAYQGGTVGTGNFAWEPMSTTTLREPNCGDYGSQVIEWSYAVSSPGYAIASGHVGA